jgi:hypothetical protein
MLIAMENPNKDVQLIERDTWQPLGAASAQLLRRLHESNAHSPVASGERSDPLTNTIICGAKIAPIVRTTIVTFVIA